MPRLQDGLFVKILVEDMPWDVYDDHSGRRFFHNRDTGELTWKPPRKEKPASPPQKSPVPANDRERSQVCLNSTFFPHYFIRRTKTSFFNFFTALLPDSKFLRNFVHIHVKLSTFGECFQISEAESIIYIVWRRCVCIYMYRESFSSRFYIHSEKVLQP